MVPWQAATYKAASEQVANFINVRSLPASEMVLSVSIFGNLQLRPAIAHLLDVFGIPSFAGYRALPKGGICLASCSHPPRRRPRSGAGGDLPGWKRVEWRKQSAGFRLYQPPEKQPRTKDDDDDEEDGNMTLNRYKGERQRSWQGVFEPVTKMPPRRTRRAVAQDWSSAQLCTLKFGRGDMLHGATEDREATRLGFRH